MSEILAEIERILGRKLEPKDERRIRDLNSVPPKLVDEARQLPPLQRRTFLNFHVHPESLEHVPAFIEEVVEGGEDVAGWRRGRTLVPGYSIRTLVQSSVEEILGPLNPRPDERWWRVRPDRELWDAREILTGAPAVRRPELDYRWTPGPNVIDIRVDKTKLESVVRVETGVRRWIASALAGAACARNIRGYGLSPDELLAACFPEILRFSTDAVASARGLIREHRELPPSALSVPGFRGPDEWYDAEH
jgi:hypothetical protein